MLNPAYLSATQYFPSEQNWGTLTYAPVTTSSGGGGGTTIINNNNVYNGVLTISALGGSASSGSVVFANSNDFTFGMVGGTITASYNNTATASNYFFSNANGITFGTAGSTVTASHNGLTNSAAFIGSAYTSHTHSQYVNTSQSSLFQHTSATSAITSAAVNTSAARIQGIIGSNTTYTSGSVSLRDLNGISFQSTTGQAFQITHALQYTSNTSAITSNALNTSQSSLFQHTSAMSDYLGTGYTTHTHSQYINTSNSSLFRHTSADSQLQFTSQMSDYLDTSYTTHTHPGGVVAAEAGNGSFSFNTLSFSNVNGVSFSTSAGSAIYVVHGLQHSSNTSAITSNALNTSQSSLFQHTSATSAITSAAVHTSAARIQGIIGSNTTYTSGSVSLRDLNGISFQSTTGQAFQITHALQFTSNTSAITSNALNTSQSSLFQHTSATSAITSAALHTSASRVINIIVATNNTGGGAASLSSNVSFSAANNFTFYTSAGNAIVGSFSQSVDTGKAGTGVTTAGGVGLSATLNTNGLSISIPSWLTTAMASNRGTDFVQANAGFNGTNASGTIASNAISVSVAAQSNQTLGLYASSQTTGQSSSSTVDARSLSIRGAGIVSVGLSGGEFIISATGGGGGLTNINLSAGTTSNNLSAFTLANGNGVSFGLNGSVVTATVQTNYLTTAALSSQTLAFTLSGNSATTNSSQILNGGYALAGGNGVTLAQSNNTVSISVATNYQSQGAYLTTAAQSTQTNAFSLGGNTGTTNSSVLSAGGYVIAGGSNVTLSMSNNSLSIHAATNALTSQSNQALSGSNGSFTFQTATFGSSNGMHFYTTNGSLVGSYTVPTVTNSSWTVSDAVTSATVGRLAFTQANGITMTLSTSNNGNHTVFASHNGLTSQSNQNVTAANGGFAFQTLSFSNVNGISFGTSAGSAITASHNALTTARASNDAIGLNTAQTNVTWTVNSAGLSLNAAGYAGTGTTFNGANISGSFTLNSNGLQASMSVAAPGAAAENNNHNLLGANTAGNTTASGSTIGLSGINLTLSGTNASVINISAPATSSLSATGLVSISTNGSTISIGVPGPYTYSGLNPYDDRIKVLTSIGQGSLMLDPQYLPNVQFDRVVVPLNNTNSSNSSGSHTLSFWIGIYTRNDSTLSLLQSASSSTDLTHSGTAGSYSLYSGLRLFTIPMTTTLTEGQYWLAYISRTTSGGANGSYSYLGISQLGSNFLGHFGSSHNTTYQYTIGQGIYNTTTSAMPASVAFNQIRGSDNGIFRFPVMMFASSTV